MNGIPKVSVIVPVYNCEKYLKRCLDSLLNQTLEAIEIIVVNDGSTDASLEICRKYALRFPNVTILDQPNGGAAKAREAGVRIAKGKYIGFLDSDDWIHPAMYETLYTEIDKNGSDIIQCRFLKTDTDNVNIEIDRRKIQMRTYPARDAMMQLFGCCQKSEFDFILWDKLFRADTLQDMASTVYHKANNDTPVIPRAFYAAQKISVIDQPFVYYFVRNDEQNKSLSDIINAKMSTWLQSNISAFDDVSEYLKEKDHPLYLASLHMTLGCSLKAMIHWKTSAECRKFATSVIKKHQIMGNPCISWKMKILALAVKIIAG